MAGMAWSVLILFSLVSPLKKDGLVSTKSLSRQRTWHNAKPGNFRILFGAFQALGVALGFLSIIDWSGSHLVGLDVARGVNGGKQRVNKYHTF